MSAAATPMGPGHSRPRLAMGTRGEDVSFVLVIGISRAVGIDVEKQNGFGREQRESN